MMWPYLFIFSLGMLIGQWDERRRTMRPFVMAQLSRGFWWAMFVAVLWVGTLRLCSGCSVEVGPSGERGPDKHPRDVEQLEPDAEQLEPDAGVGLIDAGPLAMPDAHQDPPDAHRDVPDAPTAPPAPLAGRWRVALKRTHGDGCTGLPVAASELWELAADLATLTTPQGELEQLTPVMWELDEKPVVRFELEPGENLRGVRVVETGFCLEVWSVVGVRP
jgi:hypothetical protein